MPPSGERDAAKRHHVLPSVRDVIRSVRAMNPISPRHYFQKMRTLSKRLGYEDGLFKKMLEKNLQDLEAESVSAAAASRTEMLWKGGMLCAVPIMGAFSTVSFHFANTLAVGGLPTSMMQLSHCLTCMASLSAVIFFRYGQNELGKLYSRQYLGMSIGGGLNGVARILSFMALQRLGPTMVVVVQQSSSLVTLCCGILLLNRKPTCLSVSSTIAGTMVALTYVVNKIQADDGSQTNTKVDMLGIVMALLCVVCDKVGDILIEFVSCKFTQKLNPEERTPEVFRMLIVNDFWKLPVVVLAWLIVDFEKAKALGNWALPSTLLAVFAPMVYNLLFNATIMVQSSLAVSLAQSGRVAFVYVLEVMLGTQSAKLASVLQLISIVSVLVLSSAAQREAMQSAAQARLKTLAEVEEIIEKEEEVILELIDEHAGETRKTMQEIVGHTENIPNIDESAKHEGGHKTVVSHFCFHGVCCQ